MIQLIDTVDCDALHKCIVKPEACRKAMLVQDAGEKNDLFALLMVDDKAALRRQLLQWADIDSLHCILVSHGQPIDERPQQT